jgi:hypothetical protein
MLNTKISGQYHGVTFGGVTCELLGLYKSAANFFSMPVQVRSNILNI